MEQTGNTQVTLYAKQETKKDANIATSVKSLYDVKLTKTELDNLQLVLDLAGMLPLVGTGADVINTAISVMRGNFSGALFSLFKAIPFVGDLAAGTKVIGNFKKYEDALAYVSKNVVNKLPKKYQDTLKDMIQQLKGGLSKEKNKTKPKEKNQVTRTNRNEKRKYCPKTCKPVNPVLGIKILLDDEDIDFVLTGDIPLVWSRNYASDSLVGRGEENDPIGWYGQGWGNNWSEQLNIVPNLDLIEYIDTSGRAINFPYIEIGESYYHRYDDIRLHHDAKGQYRITSGSSMEGDGIQIHFGDPNINQDSPIYPCKQRLYCTGQSDNYGNRITLEYHQENNKSHLPHYIKDSTGRLLEFEFNLIKNAETKGLRLHSIHELTNLNSEKLSTLISHINPKLNQQQEQLQQAQSGSIEKLIHQIKELITTGTINKEILKRHTLVRYHYNKSGDLIEVNPHLAPTRRFDYKNHIMTAHHIDGGLSSYYEYDQYLPTGKVQTNHISNGQTYHFDYQKDHTIVTGARGTDNERQEIYYFDQDKNWIGYTNGLGQTTKFNFDEDDRLIQIAKPNGSITQYSYSGNLLANIKELIDHDINQQPIWRTQQYLYV